MCRKTSSIGYIRHDFICIDKLLKVNDPIKKVADMAKKKSKNLASNLENQN